MSPLPRLHHHDMTIVELLATPCHNKVLLSHFKTLSLNLALTLGCLNPKNFNTNPNPDPNSNPNPNNCDYESN